MSMDECICEALAAIVQILLCMWLLWGGLGK